MDKEPNIEFKIKSKKKKEYALTTNVDIFDYIILKGKEYIYLWRDEKIYRCSKEYENSVIKLLDTFKINFTKEIVFKKEEFADFYSLVMPLIKGKVNLDEVNYEEIKRIYAKKTKSKSISRLQQKKLYNSRFEICI